MQTPQDYVERQLQKLGMKSDAPLPKTEEELHAHITKAVLSKKFRKWSVDEEFHAHLDSAIRLSFAKKEPIKFVLPFGGYKLWRLEEAPEADWAELFSLMFYAAWLKPIADAYGPGVWFDFSSDDVIVERLNNIPKADTEAYRDSFNKIISFLQGRIPSNVRFTFTPVGSRYTEEEFDSELEEKIQMYMDEHDGELPTPTKAEITMIDLNANPTEQQRADPLWYAKNKLVHDVFMTMSRRRPYTRTEDKILTFTKPLPVGVAVGTTKTSMAKFWAGVGALKKREESYIETVLSPEQIQNATATWESMSLDGLEGKNFKKIRIL